MNAKKNTRSLCDKICCRQGLPFARPYSRQVPVRLWGKANHGSRLTRIPLVPERGESEINPLFFRDIDSNFQYQAEGTAVRYG